MKKLLLLLFIALLTISLTSCGSVPMFNEYGYTKGWAFKEIPPSQVDTGREDFFEGNLSDGRTFSVGELIYGDDSAFYYNALMQDFGWTRKGDEFEGIYTTTPKRGHLYIHLKREVAVYFYPVSSFNVFRTTIKPKEDN